MDIKNLHQRYFNRQYLVPGLHYFIFWSWHLVLALVTGFWFVEYLIWPVLTGAVIGSIPADLGVFALVLFILPVVCAIVALTPAWRGRPDKLLRLFYGVEAPLLFLVLMRLTLLRELQPATLQILLVFLIGIGAFAWRLFRQGKEDHGVRSALGLALNTMALLAGIYVGLLTVFFAVPLIWMLIKAMFSFEWIEVFFKAPFLSMLLVVFLVYTCTLFAMLPVMMPYLYGRGFYLQLKSLSRKTGVTPWAVLAAAVVAVNIMVFYWVNQQPQTKAFALLEQGDQSPDQRRRLIAEKDLIRDGLLNAYLAPYRYTSSADSANIVTSLFHEAFNTGRDGVGITAQYMFNTLARPFLYRGPMNHEERRRAAQRYKRFFDQPIIKAERAAIQHAVKSNWQRQGVVAGLIDKDEKKVLLTRQALTIDEKAQWAAITLDEVYENQTFTAQETLIHFSLPPEAVLTGVWLSHQAGRPEQFPFVVAPRGAAQQVYQQEVTRSIDPALLEQVGPRQYRLRAFPVPPKRQSEDRAFGVEQERLYLRLRYAIPLDGDGKWAMPQLLEKRNVYWHDDIPWIINGQAVRRHNDRWLPDEVNAERAMPLTKQSVRLNTEAGAFQVDVERQPSTTPEGLKGRYAFLIDTSFSMAAHAGALETLLTDLQAISKRPGLALEVFTVGRTMQSLEMTTTVNTADWLFFGHSGHLQHLHQWRENRQSEPYDGVVLITDEGSYEIEEQGQFNLPQRMPVWVLHINEALPYAYDDRLLDLIRQSGGGVVTHMDHLLARLATKQSSKADTVISDEFKWTFRDAGVSKPATDAPLLSHMAARQWIVSARRSIPGENGKSLDALHRLAQNHGVITPYSSMIVLVNERQQEALESLSNKDDRFDRSVETGTEDVSTPIDPFTVQAVPEPHEWLLMAVVVLFLAYRYRQRRMVVKTESIC